MNQSNDLSKASDQGDKISQITKLFLKYKDDTFISQKKFIKETWMKMIAAAKEWCCITNGAAEKAYYLVKFMWNLKNTHSTLFDNIYEHAYYGWISKNFKYGRFIAPSVVISPEGERVKTIKTLNETSKDVTKEEKVNDVDKLLELNKTTKEISFDEFSAI